MAPLGHHTILHQCFKLLKLVKLGTCLLRQWKLGWVVNKWDVWDRPQRERVTPVAKVKISAAHMKK